MTKAQLIEALKDLPDDAPIFYNDSEEGCCEVNVATVRIAQQLEYTKEAMDEYPSLMKDLTFWGLAENIRYSSLYKVVRETQGVVLS